MIEPSKLFNRRRAGSLGISAFVVLIGSHVKASTPAKPVPSPIEELIPRMTLLISTGKLNRQVFITQDLEKKLISGEKIHPSDKRLFNFNDLGGSEPISTFLEITHSQPIWANPDALGLPAYTGTVYCYGSSAADRFAELKKLIGQECIFLFYSLTGYTATGMMQTFPSPLYSQVSDGHWREALPLPIAELKRVSEIAKKAGFVKPQRIIKIKARG